MSHQKRGLEAAKRYIGTTISSPTRGWYEVYRNTDSEQEGEIHLKPVEYFGVDQFISAEELADRLSEDGGWSVVYEGTTQSRRGDER